MKTTIPALREKIAALKAERAALQAQPRSRADVRAAVVECISGFAAEAQARQDRALRNVANGHSPRTSILAAVGQCGPAGLGERSIDIVGLVGMLGPDAVADVLLARLEATVGEGVGEDARAQRLAAIDDELDRLEAEEENAIVLSESTGSPITRRDDARIEIVLAATGAAATTRPASTPPRDVVDDIGAEQHDRNMRRARERLQAAPARSEYLQRRDSEG